LTLNELMKFKAEQSCASDLLHALCTMQLCRALLPAANFGVLASSSHIHHHPVQQQGL
jgi:hypothetical protein